MPTKIGHFEILSELAKSPTEVVYKANDPESGQTIALKAIQLNAFDEHASALEHALLAEAEATKVLSSPNITNVYGAGEIEGRFCAAMEYVQGNSIATMLARKEGFSIWDLLDIGRQLCGALEHAKSHNIVHYSLEPSKIMCGWDGTVKILSYGVSSVGNFVQHAAGVSSILHYMSPEQVRGEAMDTRSNLFSLGAMFYEMVTERKAFDRDDVDSLRQSILESTPVAPAHINPKIHPLLSDLIMKALAKDPAERYQTGRELLDDLEKCKETKPAVTKKAAEPAKGLMIPGQAKAAAQSRFVGASAPKPAAAAPKPVSLPARPAQPAATRLSTPVAAPPAKPAERKPAVPAASAAVHTANLAKPTAPKAAAAAAGIGTQKASISTAPEPALSNASVAEPPVAEPMLTESTIAVPTPEALEPSFESMSAAATEEPQVESFDPQVSEDEPRITVDPMMAEGDSGANTGVSFSDISELPPLKEVYVAPPPPPPADEPEPPAAAPTVTVFKGTPKAQEKPKVQPREVAQKAIKEIKGVPPKLMLYSLSAAGVLILAIGIGMTIYIHNLGNDDDSGSARATAPAAQQAPAQPQPVQPAPQQPAPQDQAQQPVPAEAQPAEAASPEPEEVAPVTHGRSRRAKKRAPKATAIIAGQLSVDSTPQGAQVQINGASNPGWVTPLTLSDVHPGQYSIIVSKPGYATDTHSITVASGGHANSVVHLSPVLAMLIVKSNPPGAKIYVDGHDVGAKTPAQVSVHNGLHSVLVRMDGYLDETMSAQFVPGQTSNFSPTLRPLGNVDSIKTVGRMSRLFGGKGAGQGTLSIRTQPRGAQIAINQHMLDKDSPIEVTLDPGTYVVDITLSGYAPVHKVITTEKKGKVVIDETLQPQ